MKAVSHVLSLAVALALGAVSGNAADGQPECACLSSAATGVVTATGGRVLVSRADGLGAATQGAPLSAGSQLITGANGSAGVRLGACALRFPANTAVSFVPAGGRICVKPVRLKATDDSDRGGVPPAIAVGSAAVAGSFGALVLGGGGSGASN